MKNQLSSIMCDIIYFFVCISLAFGQTACAPEKQNPTATSQSTQNGPNVERSTAPSMELSAEKTATVSPSGSSEKTPENGTTIIDNGNITITFATYESMKSFYIPMMEEFHQENRR